MQISEMSTYENNCYTQGVNHMCNNQTDGSTQFMKIPNPSHRISLNKIRKLKILQTESKILKQDTLNILKNSVCVVSNHYNLYKRNWAINFCDKAYTEAKQYSNIAIPAAQFLMVCRAAFYPLQNNILCPDEFSSEQKRETVFELALELYDNQINKINSNYVIDFNFNIYFESEQMDVLNDKFTYLNSRLKFKYHPNGDNSKGKDSTLDTLNVNNNNQNFDLRAESQNQYILTKMCKDVNQKQIILKNEVVKGQKDLVLLDSVCQKDEFSSWEKCYGKYITLIFYIPEGYEYIEF